MTKVKSNALSNNLTADQLKALDRWLFEEKQGYKAVLEKAQTQLRYQGSISSLQRYFLRRRKERAVEEFREMREEVAAVSGAAEDPTKVHEASKKLLARFLFERLRGSPEDVKEALSVAKLMVQNDHNEVLREAKAEEFELRRKLKEKDHEIRLKAMAFAKDKFEYDAIENAVKALPHLQRLAEAMEDPGTTKYRERAIEARQAMFGTSEEVLPETAQEEAEGKGGESNNS
jgi:Protein of unknown function (DUF3486)